MDVHPPKNGINRYWSIPIYVWSITDGILYIAMVLRVESLLQIMILYLLYVYIYNIKVRLLSDLFYLHVCIWQVEAGSCPYWRKSFCASHRLVWGGWRSSLIFCIFDAWEYHGPEYKGQHTILDILGYPWAAWKAAKRPKWCNMSDRTLIRGVTLNAARWIVEIDSSGLAWDTVKLTIFNLFRGVSPNGGHQKWLLS
jgi:hypothetical protein